MSYPNTYTMRYMGSKLKLLDFIVPKIEEMISEGDSILDIMAGTHSVGYALKSRHPIIANDAQEYSKINGVARIQNNSVNLSIKDIEKDILTKINNNKVFKYFVKNYSDTYFSKKQCIDIDNIRFAIEQVRQPVKRALYLSALIYAMGYCQSSPGHFAQYMPKTHKRLKLLRKLSIIESFTKQALRNQVIFSNYKNKILAMDYRKLLTEKNIDKYLKNIKLVYVDPPYSEAQYSRFYHVLETVVKYDNPKLFHKGLYREDRLHSKFGYANKVNVEFDFIIKNTAQIGAKIAISYSENGMLSPKKIALICKQYFNEVKIYSFKHKHSMQGRGMLDIKEVLITAQ